MRRVLLGALLMVGAIALAGCGRDAGSSSTVHGNVQYAMLGGKDHRTALWR